MGDQFNQKSLIKQDTINQKKKKKIEDEMKLRHQKSSIAHKNQDNSSKSNVCKNTFLLFKDMIEITLVMMLALSLGIQDCVHVKKDVALRNSVDYGKYLNYMDVTDDFIHNYNHIVYEIANFNIAELLDPFFSGLQPPFSEITGFDNEYIKVNKEINGLTLDQSIEKLKEDQTSLGIYIPYYAQAIISDGYNYIDYYRHKPGASIQGGTTDVLYFTKCISDFYYLTTSNDYTNIQNTERDYRTPYSNMTKSYINNENLYSYDFLMGAYYTNVSSLIYKVLDGDNPIPTQINITSYMSYSIMPYTDKFMMKKMYYNPMSQIVVLYDYVVTFNYIGLAEKNVIMRCYKPFFFESTSNYYSQTNGIIFSFVILLIIDILDILWKLIKMGNSILQKKPWLCFKQKESSDVSNVQNDKEIASQVSRRHSLQGPQKSFFTKIFQKSFFTKFKDALTSKKDPSNSKVEKDNPSLPEQIDQALQSQIEEEIISQKNVYKKEQLKGENKDIESDQQLINKLSSGSKSNELLTKLSTKEIEQQEDKLRKAEMENDPIMNLALQLQIDDKKNNYSRTSATKSKTDKKYSNMMNNSKNLSRMKGKTKNMEASLVQDVMMKSNLGFVGSDMGQSNLDYTNELSTSKMSNHNDELRNRRRQGHIGLEIKKHLKSSLSTEIRHKSMSYRCGKIGIIIKNQLLEIYILLSFANVILLSMLFYLFKAFSDTSKLMNDKIKLDKDYLCQDWKNNDLCPMGSTKTIMFYKQNVELASTWFDIKIILSLLMMLLGIRSIYFGFNSVGQVKNFLSLYYRTLQAIWKTKEIFFFIIIYVLAETVVMMQAYGSEFFGVHNLTISFFNAILLCIMDFSVLYEYASSDSAFAIVNMIFVYLVVIIFMNVILRSRIVDAVIEMEALNNLLENITDPFDYHPNIIFGMNKTIRKAFKSCWYWCCHHQKYKKRLYADRTTQLRNEEYQKIKSNQNFDERINAEMYQSDYFIKIYPKDTTAIRYWKILKVILELFLLAGLVVATFSMWGSSTEFKTRLPEDRITNNLKWGGSTFFNEFELRRYFVNNLPILLAKDSSLTYKADNVTYSDGYIDIPAMDIVYDWVFSAQYSKIDSREGTEYGYYSKYIFDSGNYIKPTLQDRDYNISLNLDDTIVNSTIVNASNITYFWNEETMTNYAVIPRATTSNYWYVMQKMVLDDFINKHLDNLQIGWINVSKMNSLINSIYGISTLDFRRKDGDSFEISYKIIFFNLFSKELNYGILIMLMSIMFYTLNESYDLFQIVRRNSTIYSIWYKIEIVSKFNKFKMYHRRRKGLECMRKIWLQPIYNIFIEILLMMLTISTIVTLKLLHTHSEFAYELMQGNDSGLERYEQLDELRTGHYYNVALSTQLFFIFIMILIRLGQNLVIFPSLRNIIQIVIRVKKIIYKKVLFQQILLSIWIQTTIHIIAGDILPSYYNPLDFVNFINIIFSFMHSEKLENYKADSLPILTALIYFVIIIPIRYYTISVVLAYIQICCEYHYCQDDDDQNVDQESKYSFKQYCWDSIRNLWFAIENTHQHRKKQILKYINKLHKYTLIIPEADQYSHITDYLQKNERISLSKISDDFINGMENNLMLTTRSLKYTKSCMNKLFIEMLIDKSLHSIYQKILKNDDHWNKNLEILYMKLIDTYLDTGNNFNNFLSIERAKGEVFSREMFVDDTTYQDFKNKFANIRSQQGAIYAYKKIMKCRPGSFLPNYSQIQKDREEENKSPLPIRRKRSSISQHEPKSLKHALESVEFDYINTHNNFDDSDENSENEETNGIISVEDYLNSIMKPKPEIDKLKLKPEIDKTSVPYQNCARNSRHVNAKMMNASQAKNQAWMQTEHYKDYMTPKKFNDSSHTVPHEEMPGISPIESTKQQWCKRIAEKWNLEVSHDRYTPKDPEVIDFYESTIFESEKIIPKNQFDFGFTRPDEKIGDKIEPIRDTIHKSSIKNTENNNQIFDKKPSNLKRNSSRFGRRVSFKNDLEYIQESPQEDDTKFVESSNGLGRENMSRAEEWEPRSEEKKIQTEDEKSQQRQNDNEIESVSKFSYGDQSGKTPDDYEAFTIEKLALGLGESRKISLDLNNEVNTSGQNLL